MDNTTDSSTSQNSNEDPRSTTVDTTLSVPISPTIAPVVKKAKFHISPKLKAALMIFTLAAGSTAALGPKIAEAFGHGSDPNLLQLTITGLILIGITSVLLNYASKIIGLSRAWLTLAIAYNAIIILIKFVVSPASLYSQTIQIGDLFGFDPNSSFGYILIAAGIALSYLLVFKMLHSIYKAKVKKNLEQLTGKLATKEINSKKTAKFVIVVILIIAMSMVGVGILPLLVGLPSLNYVSSVLAGAGLVLLVLIAAALFTAKEAFKEAADTSIQLRDPAILATFFWLGLSLILIYHVLWVIYMTVMLSIWPFHTIAPSGK